jgi:hypothetical protein
VNPTVTVSSPRFYIYTFLFIYFLKKKTPTWGALSAGLQGYGSSHKYLQHAAYLVTTAVGNTHPSPRHRRVDNRHRITLLLVAAHN